MSRNVNGVPVIEAEPDFICFQCGKVAETRPYGPNNDFLAVGPTYATLPAEEQERLGRQIGIMRDYSEVLGQRIAAFPAA